MDGVTLLTWKSEIDRCPQEGNQHPLYISFTHPPSLPNFSACRTSHSFHPLIHRQMASRLVLFLMLLSIASVVMAGLPSRNNPRHAARPRAAQEPIKYRQLNKTSSADPGAKRGHQEGLAQASTVR